MDSISAIVSSAGSIVTGGLSWLTSTVSTVVGSPLLSFWALIGLVGAGIGLYHRIAG